MRVLACTFRARAYRARAYRARAFLAWSAVAALALAACAPIGPRWQDAPHVVAVEPVAAATEGALARIGASVLAPAARDESALALLDGNADALNVRLALVDLAVESLDVQYFIWQDDMTGRLLLRHVLAAADRGVRVRLLLDDLALGGRDAEVAGLVAHPGIEVRLFNPWRIRRQVGRPLEFVARMPVLNHRMHNKVLVADGHFGVIGGRNIGDRYFGVYDRFVQNDIDVLIAGPVVDEVRQSFIQYWEADDTVPPTLRAADATPAALVALQEECAAVVAEHAHTLQAFRAPAEGWQGYLERFVERSVYGAAHVLQDSPLIRQAAPTQLYEEFKAFIGSARRDVLLSSPYLVPDRRFIALLERLVERGVRVRIVTNSLASNSHVVAHSAYKKWRRALLATGAQIYEMRANAEILPLYSTDPVEPATLALHTKAVVVDGRRSFIGSPNVDPRSMILNTEIGVVAESEALAAQVTALLERDMLPRNAWRVTLEDGGWLKWRGEDEVLNRQPALGFRQRLVEFFMNLLPIKNQT